MVKLDECDEILIFAMWKFIFKEKDKWSTGVGFVVFVCCCIYMKGWAWWSLEWYLIIIRYECEKCRDIIFIDSKESVIIIVTH